MNVSPNMTLNFDLPSILAAKVQDTCCTKFTIRAIRFGSKCLSRWQQSYGPTNLELLGVVTSVLDCASYIRGRHFECDHEALKPLFQKQLKGAIYERLLAILQQFDFDIIYRPAAQMVVHAALSRNTHFSDMLGTSPDEDDPYFQCVPEKPTKVRFVSPNSEACITTFRQVNHINVIDPDEQLYDADTEDNSQERVTVKRKK